MIKRMSKKELVTNFNLHNHGLSNTYVSFIVDNEDGTCTEYELQRVQWIQSWPVVNIWLKPHTTVPFNKEDEVKIYD